LERGEICVFVQISIDFQDNDSFMYKKTTYNPLCDVPKFHTLNLEIIESYQNNPALNYVLKHFTDLKFYNRIWTMRIRNSTSLSFQQAR
jgi:hypothetical protein